MLCWRFTDAQHPPKPPAGEVGVYTGDSRPSSTTRLVYKYRGVHVTVLEARERFTMTARWKGWTHTEMGLDTWAQARDLAKTYIEIVSSIAGSFESQGRHATITEQVRLTLAAVRGNLADLEDQL